MSEYKCHACGYEYNADKPGCPDCQRTKLVGCDAGLAADYATENIREIHARLSEKHDVGWTELAVLTAKEYAESLRVPQYDLELRLAGKAIVKWKEIAHRLYLALGCKKNEHLRIQAEAAYLNAKAANAPSSATPPRGPVSAPDVLERSEDVARGSSGARG